MRLAPLCTVLCAARLSAQQITGVVRDSGLRQPVAGAVVSLLDSTGQALSRAITNGHGEYRIAWFTRGRAMRVQRIGYRPASVPWSPERTIQDFSLASIPMMLEPVDVRVAAKCPKRPDQYAALSLLAQTRSALLNMIVARDMNPATSMMRIVYRREMVGNTERIAHQSVHVYRDNDERESFFSAHPAGQFVDSGFVDHAPEGAYYHGPDAETVIDERFASGYCFRVADRVPDRPEQVGLGFEPATRKKNRVDLEGTIWIDTIARALIRIDYKYVGVTPPVGISEPDGFTSFHELPNGVVFVDRWRIRGWARSSDSVWYGRNRVRSTDFFTTESGGELAQAAWADGSIWHTSLGTLRLALTRGGVPLPHASFALDDTDYRGEADSTGVVTIPYLLPGPYRGVFVDTIFSRPLISASAELRFSAERASLTPRSIAIPSPASVLRDGCINPLPAQWQRTGLGNAMLELLRRRDTLPAVYIKVTSADRRPAVGAAVDVDYDLGYADLHLTERDSTLADGMARPCIAFQPLSQVRVQARYQDTSSPMSTFTVKNAYYPLVLRPHQ